jgi:hypothetical protein
MIDTIEGNNIVRVNGNTQTVLHNNKVVYTKQNLQLRAISKPRTKPLFISNPNIGVIDTETYLDIDGNMKIYTLGFKTNLSELPVIYYVDPKTKNSKDIVIEMIPEILRPKYENTIFYCHNLGGYDAYFIVPLLYDYNDMNPNDQFEINYIFRAENCTQR